MVTETKLKLAQGGWNVWQFEGKKSSRNDTDVSSFHTLSRRPSGARERAQWRDGRVISLEWDFSLRTTRSKAPPPLLFRTAVNLMSCYGNGHIVSSLSITLCIGVPVFVRNRKNYRETSSGLSLSRQAFYNWIWTRLGNVTVYTGAGAGKNEIKYECKSWPWVYLDLQRSCTVGHFIIRINMTFSLGWEWGRASWAGGEESVSSFRQRSERDQAERRDGFFTLT